MASTRPLISNSSSPFNNPLVTVSRAPITIRINISFMLLSFFKSRARSRYLSFFLLSFNSTLLSARIANSTILQVLFFLLIIIRSGRLAEIKWSICISKSHWGLCVTLSRTDARLWIYLLFVWSNFNFLHNSQWITLPTQSCLVFLC